LTGGGVQGCFARTKASGGVRSSICCQSKNKALRLGVQPQPRSEPDFAPLGNSLFNQPCNKNNNKFDC
jgi:hypothetical protein